MTWRTFLPVFTVHLACLLQLMLGPRASFLTVLYVFALVPLLDAVLPRDRRNPDDASARRLEGDGSFRTVLFVAVLADTGVLALALARAAHFDSLEFVGHALAVGLVMGGVGLTAAHELLHKPRWTDRAFAYLALIPVGYAHFVIEHVFGHHRRAATLDDPATARRGETVYAFVWRSVRDSWRSASDIEARRLSRLGQPSRGARNVVLCGAAASVLLTCAVWRVLGPVAVVFLLLQAAVAVILLEMVNYIEHYGLVRARVGDRWEPFGPRHAWDSDHGLSNRLLFRLARHADHHGHASRPYQVLRHLDESPKLPGGYPTMLLVSLLPPLWRALMHPRLPLP